ncbi:hypothetical protein FRC18_003279 [Serendipita sp. 400]|nr:hypothetical protein FRC18_003279 [Serendipita sp. 400]
MHDYIRPIMPLLAVMLTMVQVVHALPLPHSKRTEDDLEKRKGSRPSTALQNCTYNGNVKTCTINKAGGIVIGVVLGFFVLVAACSTICAWRAKKKKGENAYNEKPKESRKEKKGKKSKKIKHSNGSVSSIATSNSNKSKPDGDNEKQPENQQAENQQVSVEVNDMPSSSGGEGAKESSND